MQTGYDSLVTKVGCGVWSGSSDQRNQRDSNSPRYQQDASAPYYQQGSSGVRSQPKMAVAFGKIEEFDAAKEDWPQYVEHLEHFFEANGINCGGGQEEVHFPHIGWPLQCSS